MTGILKAADLIREAADAEERAASLFDQINTERMKIAPDGRGARPLHVPGCEGMLAEATSLLARARDIRVDMAVSSLVDTTSAKVDVAPMPRPTAEVSPTTAPTIKSTPQPADEVEALARRILDSDTAAYNQSEKDEIGAVAQRIAAADIGEPGNDVEAIVSRICKA